MYGYNNPYLQNYPNYQQNNNISQQNMNVPRANTSPDERIWVQNESGAENFLLAPSSFVRLWSATENKFYEKRTDASGRPMPMEVYEYTKVLPQNDVSEASVTKLPMDEINARFEEITSRIDELEKAKKVVKNAKQSNADDTSV